MKLKKYLCICSCIALCACTMKKEVTIIKEEEEINDRFLNTYQLIEQSLPDELKTNEQERLDILQVQDQIVYFRIDNKESMYGGMPDTLRLYSYNIESKETELLKTFHEKQYVWDIVTYQDSIYMTIEDHEGMALYRDDKEIARYPDNVTRFPNLNIVNDRLCMITYNFKPYSESGDIQINVIEKDDVKTVSKDTIYLASYQDKRVINGESFAYHPKSETGYILRNEDQSYTMKRYDGDKVIEESLQGPNNIMIPLESGILLGKDTNRVGEDGPVYQWSQDGQVQLISSFIDNMHMIHIMEHDQFYYSDEQEQIHLASINDGNIITEPLDLKGAFQIYTASVFRDVAFKAQDSESPYAFYYIDWLHE